MLGLGAGGAMAWLTTRAFEWGALLDAFADVQWLFLLPAVGAVVLAGLFEALRWKVLLIGEPISLTRLFLMRNTANGINSLSPIRIFGDIAQSFILCSEGGLPVHKVVSAVVVSRAFDLIVTINLVAFGILLLPQLAGFRYVLAPAWALAWGVGIGILLLSASLGRFPVLSRFQWLRSFSASIGAEVKMPGVMLATLVLTTLVWMSIGAAAWLVAGATGVDLHFWPVAVVIVAVTMFTGAIPQAPGGAGSYEFGAVSTLGLFAVEPAVAFTFAVLIHAIVFLPPIIIGLPFLFSERRAFGKSYRGAMDAIRHSLPVGSRA